jgi:hypothetical protein
MTPTNARVAARGVRRRSSFDCSELSGGDQGRPIRLPALEPMAHPPARASPVLHTQSLSDRPGIVDAMSTSTIRHAYDMWPQYNR